VYYTDMDIKQEKSEFEKISTPELLAYYKICQMNGSMIQSAQDAEQNARHLEVVTAILTKRGALGDDAE